MGRRDGGPGPGGQERVCGVKEGVEGGDGDGGRGLHLLLRHEGLPDPLLEAGADGEGGDDAAVRGESQGPGGRGGDGAAVEGADGIVSPALPQEMVLQDRVGRAKPDEEGAAERGRPLLPRGQTPVFRFGRFFGHP